MTPRSLECAKSYSRPGTKAAAHRMLLLGQIPDRVAAGIRHARLYGLRRGFFERASTLERRSALFANACATNRARSAGFRRSNAVARKDNPEGFSVLPPCSPCLRDKKDAAVPHTFPTPCESDDLVLVRHWPLRQA